MKVLSQLLGRYSNNHKPLILFRLPDTDTLFYRLSDIEPIFKLPTLSYTKSAFKNCYRDNEDTYLNTQVLSDIAGQFNRHLLAELCKLKPNDYNMGLADAILQTFPEFKRAPKEEHIWESVQLPLENLEDIIEREVKTEPSSPPSVNQVIPVAEISTRGQNAMALDKVLLNSSELRRQSALDLEKPAKKQKISSGPEREKRPHSLSAVTTATTSAAATGTKHIRKLHSYPPIINQDQVLQQQQQPPSDAALISNKKRLSIKHKNALNLTIFAPSYNEQLTGVRSAPINSNFNKSTQPQHQLQQQQHQHQQLPHHHHQQQQQQHKYVVGSSHLAPASATIARPPYHHQPSPRRHEFAIPPIVPSQQQPPHTAHPTSRENMSYQQYMASPSLYGSHPHSKPHPPPPQTASAAAAAAAAYSHAQSKRNHESQPQIAVTAASVPLPPKTPTTNSFAALQRQQYLQPFEHLFDTIETTRTLKSTLDDQIRRSSSLMQTLQASATTIEGLVRNQVKEAQWEMMIQMEQTVEGLVRRIEAIENRLDHSNNQNTTTNSTLMTTSTKINKRLPEQLNSTSLPSPLPSATTKEERAAAEDLVAFSERRRENHHYQPASSLSSSDELQTPPTIVRSQNDIGPQEYHNMLNTLRERLDRLERQIETIADINVQWVLGGYQMPLN
ncbi:hypothetical protein MAM1_0129c06095 [Mucor ambiguus]|uniref:Uncharacterized protein n=1 Tax=Mucor ambiguus TaxID=91626 RepID=A0A0C9MWS1_9FUNG|nr:hypothetical protein MAM1_0129c06095 [Mucor ambiguus]